MDICENIFPFAAEMRIGPDTNPNEEIAGCPPANTGRPETPQTEHLAIVDSLGDRYRNLTGFSDDARSRAIAASQAWIRAGSRAGRARAGDGEKLIPFVRLPGDTAAPFAGGAG